MKELQVITGCMFAGKSTELIRRLESHNENFLLVKPKLDNRDKGDIIVTHSGIKIKAKRVRDLSDIFDTIAGVKVLGIDEAQFFDNKILDDLMYLRKCNIKIILAGLEKDYLDNFFGSMKEIIKISDSVTRLKASCTRCTNSATHSYRKTKGSNNQFLIGDKNSYEALCAECYHKTIKIDGK